MVGAMVALGAMVGGAGINSREQWWAAGAGVDWGAPCLLTTRTPDAANASCAMDCQSRLDGGSRACGSGFRYPPLGPPEGRGGTARQ